MKTTFLTWGMMSCLLLSSCQQPNIKMTQLQVRQMQTRTYDVKDPRRALKAVLNVLQDEAFIPKQASLDLGYIHATKEVDVTDGNEAFWAKFWKGKNARWRKNAVVDCVVNVTEIADGMRLRVNFQVKMLNNRGEVEKVQAILDPYVYQQFLQKVDKGVFYENQGL